MQESMSLEYEPSSEPPPTPLLIRTTKMDGRSSESHLVDPGPVHRGTSLIRNKSGNVRCATLGWRGRSPRSPTPPSPTPLTKGCLICVLTVLYMPPDCLIRVLTVLYMPHDCLICVLTVLYVTAVSQTGVRLRAGAVDCLALQLLHLQPRPHRLRRHALVIPIPSQRALPTETKVESGTSQSKSGTSVNLSNSGHLQYFQHVNSCRRFNVHVKPNSEARNPKLETPTSISNPVLTDYVATRW